MIKITHWLLTGFVGLGLVAKSRAQQVDQPPTEAAASRIAAAVDPAAAQDVLPDPLPTDPNSGIGSGVLQSLPTLRNVPASLFSPPPPPIKAPLAVDAPYFVPDPLLDRPHLGAPGWFGGAELQVLKPHLLSQLRSTVANSAQRAAGTSSTVQLPDAPLNWTVSPRFYLGYRLPSGFGDFMISERFLTTSGTETLRTGDGPANLRSRLAFNMIDFDYNSRELSLWPRWDIRWTLGGRILTTFFDSRLNQPLSQAAAGSGFFQVSQFNNLTGGGPHAALELARHLGDSGWSFDVRGDFAGVYEGSRLGFSTLSTTLGPTGRPLAGQSRLFGHQDAPILNLRAGLNWQPFPSSLTRFFLGYQFERFWALNGEGPTGPPSRGQLWDQGAVLQVNFNF